MIGKVLGFDEGSNSGIITNDRGDRYKFRSSEWRDELKPEKNMKIDFVVGEDSEAKDIYIVTDFAVENTKTILAFLAVVITFFFGFIGTFISRLALAKQPLPQTLAPTFIHLAATVFVVVPFIGWLVYLIVSIYYMVKNYQIVNNKKY